MIDPATKTKDKSYIEEVFKDLFMDGLLSPKSKDKLKEELN